MIPNITITNCAAASSMSPRTAALFRKMASQARSIIVRRIKSSPSEKNWPKAGKSNQDGVRVNRRAITPRNIPRHCQPMRPRVKMKPAHWAATEASAMPSIFISKPTTNRMLSNRLQILTTMICTMHRRICCRPNRHPNKTIFPRAAGAANNLIST